MTMVVRKTRAIMDGGTIHRVFVDGRYVGHIHELAISGLYVPKVRATGRTIEYPACESLARAFRVLVDGARREVA